MIYDLIAPIYDGINSTIDYVKWADFIENVINKNSSFSKESLVLDLGCGTGKMTVELAKRGYDLIGIDHSTEMLNIARESAFDNGLNNVLLLCQDIREFELYGTVEVIVSCLDTINHIVNRNDLSRVFSLAHNYLVDGGLFIFDINGEEKFKNIYAQNSYVNDNDESMCIWQNYYNENTKICDFYITLFTKNRDGTYTRSDETEREKMYTVRTLNNLLTKNGFDFVGAYSDFNFASATDRDERIYIVAKCVKE